MLILLADIRRDTARLITIVAMPTMVSITLKRSMNTRYTNIIAVLSTSGANVLTSTDAMDALVPCR